MAHTDRTRRTERPHREVTFLDWRWDGDLLVVDTTTVTQEYGRRAGLHDHKSQISERRRRVNRRDRHEARTQLRDPRRHDDVETRQPRGRAISLGR